MASEVFEEPLELEIGLLEAGAPTRDSYPYPSLKPTGSSETRSFRSIILENQYLRASFVPALGGRLLRLFDKRTKTELLSQGSLAPVVGGCRGAFLNAGIGLHLQGSDRLTSLASVLFSLEEADEDQPAGLWLSEGVTGTGLSWHLHVTMPEDRAELIFEGRVFNRTFAPVSYNAGLMLPSGSKNLGDGKGFLAATGGNGVALIPHRGQWSARLADGSLAISRFEEPRPLAGRQLDTWTVSLTPFSGLEGVSAVSKVGAIFVGEDRLQVQAAEPMLQHKLVLLTEGGDNLESAVQLYPDKLFDIAMKGPKAVVLLDPLKDVLLRWEVDTWKDIDAVALGISRRDAGGPSYLDKDDSELQDLTFEVARRHLAHLLLGMRALAKADYDEAGHQFEQTLLYNAEDHLAWWMKAMTHRLFGTDHDQEAPELPNAHYLAPLDPILRAEGYLSQPRTMEKAPSAFLQSFAEQPEAFIEVACLLVEAALYEEASRWIDEALRHVDLPMLHYLLAYCHLRRSGLDFEAADHVAAASKQPIGPPYPWRDIEIAATEGLRQRFPEDERLKELATLIEDLRR